MLDCHAKWGSGESNRPEGGAKKKPKKKLSARFELATLRLLSACSTTELRERTNVGFWSTNV